MTSSYIDTSVLGAYYCPEALSEKAQDTVCKIDHPVISLLTEVEFFALIAKKKRMRDFGETKARTILMQFQAHVDEGYYRKLLPMSDNYLKARDMIAEFKANLRTLDAIHLALTVAEKLALVTADQTMASAAKRFGIETTLIS